MLADSRYNGVVWLGLLKPVQKVIPVAWPVNPRTMDVLIDEILSLAGITVSLLVCLNPTASLA